MILWKSLTRLVLLLITALSAQAGVVINEILYHAPNDVEDLEYVELHNSGEQTVDLSGWKFTKGIRYQFSPGTTIEAGGFLVLCRNQQRFQEAYSFDARGVFKEPLSNNGASLELANARGEKVDQAKYKDSPPWPLSPDGHTASLERISPLVDGDLPQNWAASPLANDAAKASGTPGKTNANFSANLAPIITNVKFTPAHPAPDQPVTVEVDVQDPNGVREVTLRFRVAGPGFENEEATVTMAPTSEHRFAGKIPGQKANQILRFRILATDQQGAQRFYPGENELRPALSCYVHEPFAAGQIPLASIIHVDVAEFKAAQKQGQGRGRGGMDEEQQRRWMALQMLENGLDLNAAWFELAMNQQLPFEQLQKVRPIFSEKFAQRDKLIEQTVESPDLEQKLPTIPAMVKTFHKELGEAIKSGLTSEQHKKFADWQQQATANPERGMQWGPEMMLKRFVNLEGGFFQLTTRTDVNQTQFEQLKSFHQAALKDRSALTNAVKAAMQGQGDWPALQEKMTAMNDSVASKLKAVLTADQEGAFAKWREEGGGFMGFRRGGAKKASPVRGRSAFVWVNQKTLVPEVCDFVRVANRNAGYKVNFHKDQSLNGMTGINLIFEYNDRFVLAEPLAYEVYRRAGNAAELTDFVRLSVDGDVLGYHLLVEQPNRAFLRRNKLKDNGNLYKILWYERGVVSQHEKKTNLRTGHEDIVELVDRLEKTKGDEQWALIKKNFNVEQVLTYHAVNACLSHWDGFFNNYFTYHDLQGTGKWTMYPWDQDKTWGFHDGLQEGALFYDMPLTFGMEGDAPPGWPKDRPPPRGVGDAWWRPGGYFSKPLLANPQFRKHYLARIKEILETVYTEEIFFPIIDDMGKRLKEEVRIRAAALKENPDDASQRLQRNLASLREHLTKRRKFLLEQEEIRTAGKFSRAELK